ncbi:8445_t:CDS:1, partial [Gigaspora margarita]
MSDMGHASDHFVKYLVATTMYWFSSSIISLKGPIISIPLYRKEHLLLVDEVFHKAIEYLFIDMHH